MPNVVCLLHEEEEEDEADAVEDGAPILHIPESSANRVFVAYVVDQSHASRPIEINNCATYQNPLPSMRIRNESRDNRSKEVTPS